MGAACIGQFENYFNSSLFIYLLTKTAAGTQVSTEGCGTTVEREKKRCHSALVPSIWLTEKGNLSLDKSTD